MADKDMSDRALEIIEMAKGSGKLKKGANEATKALERGTAKFVAYAGDVTPKEVIMHIPLIAKEKGIPCIEVESKEELGTAAGIGIATAAIAVIDPGDAKKAVEELKDKLG